MTNKRRPKAFLCIKGEGPHPKGGKEGQQRDKEGRMDEEEEKRKGRRNKEMRSGERKERKRDEN